MYTSILRTVVTSGSMLLVLAVNTPARAGVADRGDVLAELAAESLLVSPPAPNILIALTNNDPLKEGMNGPTTSGSNAQAGSQNQAMGASDNQAIDPNAASAPAKDDSRPAQASHGQQTRIVVPQTVYSVLVKGNDTVIQSQSKMVSVFHLDVGTPCFPVKEVKVHLQHPDGSVSGYVCNPNSCSFNFDKCSLLAQGIFYENSYLDACRLPERAKNGWQGYLPLAALTLSMSYATGGTDVLYQTYTNAEVLCEAVPCTPLLLAPYDKPDYPWLNKGYIGQPYASQLFSGGRNPVVTRLTTNGSAGLPPGLELDRNGKIYGTPSAYSRGEWKLNFEIKDGCPWNQQSKSGTATLKIVDTVPPVIKSTTLTPTTLDASGGDVVLSVKASDNIAVFRVLLTQTAPDGHKGSAITPLVAGTPADGEWRWKWVVWNNSSSEPQKYLMEIKVEDADGNVVSAAPITLTVAGKTAPLVAPKPPISGPVMIRPTR